MRAWLALGGLALVALALRLHQLDLSGFWMDELATIYFIRLPWPILLGPIAHAEPNPPGFYVLMKLLRPIFGEGEFGLRLPSALAGVGALLPLYFFTRRSFGVVAALLAVLLLAVTAEHVHYSQEARNYALLFLGFMTLLLWMDRALGAPSLAQGLGIGLVAAALVYLHTTAAFALVALAAYALALMLLRRDASALPMLTVAGATATLLCAWWLLIAANITASQGNAISWMQRPDWAEALRLLTRAIMAPFPDGRQILASLVCGALLLIAAWRAQRARHHQALALLAALLTGALVLALVSQFRPILLERTALFLLAFAVPLYAYAITALPRPVVLPTLAGILLLHAMALREWYASDAAIGRNAQPWNAAVRLVEARMGAGERIVILGSFEMVAVPLYGGARLAESGAVWMVAGDQDRLANLAIAHAPMPVWRFRPDVSCPPPEVSGLWSIGFADAAASPLSAGLARCGWYPVSQQRLVALAVVDWRPR